MRYEKKRTTDHSIPLCGLFSKKAAERRMSTAQSTLREFDDVEVETVVFTKTVVFHLRRPTGRKQGRLDRAIESAHSVRAEAARRIPSVPKRRWSSTYGTWDEWGKEMDSHLSNNTVIENIRKVRESFRSWQSGGYDGDRPSVSRFDGYGGCLFKYDQPKYKIHDGSYYLSLPLAAGRGERELLPLRDSDYLREYVDRILDGGLDKGRGELIEEDGKYRFNQSVRTDVDVIADPKTSIGVDIGLTNLAVAGAVGRGEAKSGAQVWSGSEVAEMRDRFYERKKQSQSDQRYEDIRDEEQRYVDHVCHVVSREVVEWATKYDRPEVVLEDLTDIRETFVSREREHTADERRALHSWPFRKLQDMIEYKSVDAGVPVRYINPENTSKECNECGHIEGDNRHGVHFECVNCGYEVHADVNAAINIASVQYPEDEDDD